jgi:FkbM family methyltransferase
MKFVVSHIKGLLRRFDVEVMSSKTLLEMERRCAILSYIDRRPLNLLANLSAICFPTVAPFFVQVGANDGVTDDELYPIVLERGWRGLVIEPQPEAFSRLQKNYEGVPGITFENLAISSGSEPLCLYRFRNRNTSDVVSSAFASTNRNLLMNARQRMQGDFEIEEIQVPVATLDSILDRHGISNVDVLLIDTEGMDYNVLTTIDLVKRAPSIIQFEHINLSKPDVRKAVELLEASNYQFALSNRDVIAVRLEQRNLATGSGGNRVNLQCNGAN